MKDMEAAVSHGYLGATVKGYSDKRHKGGPVGKPLSALAVDMGSAVRHGASPDGPLVH